MPCISGQETGATDECACYQTQLKGGLRRWRWVATPHAIKMMPIDDRRRTPGHVPSTWRDSIADLFGGGVDMLDERHTLDEALPQPHDR